MRLEAIREAMETWTGEIMGADWLRDDDAYCALGWLLHVAGDEPHDGDHWPTIRQMNTLLDQYGIDEDDAGAIAQIGDEMGPEEIRSILLAPTPSHC